jgi:succinoglycan biosynthesis transport protein ExoP
MPQQTPPDRNDPQSRTANPSYPLPVATGALGQVGTSLANPVNSIFGGPSDEDGFSVGAFMHSLRRRWLVATGLGLILAAIVAAVLWLLVPVYFEAETLLRARRSQPALLGNYRIESDKEFEVYKQTQVSLIKSRLVLDAALGKPGVNRLSIVQHEDDPLEWLQRELVVKFMRDSEILRISLRSRNAEEAEDMVKAVQEAYMDEIVFNERKEALVRSDILKRSYRQNMTSIKEKAEELMRLQEEVGTSDSRLAQLNEEFALSELASLRRNLDQKRALLDQVKRQLTVAAASQNGLPYVPPDALIENELLRDRQYAEAKQTINLLEDQLAYYATPGQQNSGTVERLRSDLAFAKSSLQRLRKDIAPGAVERLRLMSGLDGADEQRTIGSLSTEMRELMRQITNDENEYREKEEAVRTMGGRSAELITRQEELNGLQETTNRLRQEIDTVELNLQREPRIQVVQPPSVANFGKITFKIALVTVSAIALFVGVFAAFTMWDYQAKRLNSQKQLSAGGIRVLGSLPRLNQKSLGLGAKRQRELVGHLEDSIGGIRSAIMFQRTEDPIRIVMVTSPLGGEGKSTVASQLAISFARAGRNTLLVDGDTRNPTQGQVFGLSSHAGLSEVMRNEVALDAVIQSTEQEQLSVLPAGSHDESSSRAISVAALERLGETEQFDYIVIDAGPVLTGPEALLLGQYADAAVLAVRQDVSKMPKILEACDRLRSVGVRIAGAVVNGVATDVRRDEIASVRRA